MITLSANLGVGAFGQTVTFTDNTGPYTIGTAIVDASGIATLNYTPWVNTTGVHTLSVTVMGSSVSYKETTLTITGTPGTCVTTSNATVCIGVTSSTQATNVIASFTASPTHAAIGATVVLTANIGSARAGEMVTFADQTKGTPIIGTATANSSGVATISYVVGGTTGTHTLSASHYGSLPSYRTLSLPVP